MIIQWCQFFVGKSGLLIGHRKKSNFVEFSETNIQEKTANFRGNSQKCLGQIAEKLSIKKMADLVGIFWANFAGKWWPVEILLFFGKMMSLCAITTETETLTTYTCKCCVSKVDNFAGTEFEQLVCVVYCTCLLFVWIHGSYHQCGQGMQQRQSFLHCSHCPDKECLSFWMLLTC